MADELRMNFPDKYKMFFIVRKHNGDAWNPSTSKFESFGEKKRIISDYTFLMISKGGSLHIADFPIEIPRGDYDIQIFYFSEGVASLAGVSRYINKKGISVLLRRYFAGIYVTTKSIWGYRNLIMAKQG